MLAFCRWQIRFTCLMLWTCNSLNMSGLISCSSMKFKTSASSKPASFGGSPRTMPTRSLLEILHRPSISLRAHPAPALMTFPIRSMRPSYPTRCAGEEQRWLPPVCVLPLLMPWSRFVPSGAQSMPLHTTCINLQLGLDWTGLKAHCPSVSTQTLWLLLWAMQRLCWARTPPLAFCAV